MGHLERLQALPTRVIVAVSVLQLMFTLGIDLVLLHILLLLFSLLSLLVLLKVFVLF